MTVWMALEAVQQLNRSAQNRIPVVYFVQDYEPHFGGLPVEAEIAAALSYVVAPENVTIVSYSEWIRKELFDRHGAPSLKVSCHPRGRKQQKRAGSIVGPVGSANTGYRSSVSAFVSEKATRIVS